MTSTNNIPENMTDTALVAAAQHGDDESFSELFNRHRLNCVKVATSILKNPDDAEEEVQNAFWKAYRNIERFQGESMFSTWVSRIVINQCLMRLRSAKRKRAISIDDVQLGEERGTLELRDERDTPETELGRDEIVRMVQQEIRRIPPLLREVLVMKDIEQRPTAEVAEQLSLTVAAVKSRLLRARRMLRTRIDRHQGARGAATLLADARV
jgi:RNA polymerase sigma-70 factor (ECF subfamily)